MNLLVTAGATREPIDPVRYLTNRSSGKMGYALALVGQQLGHRVTLISGPTSLDIPPLVDFIPVETAEEMLEAVKLNIKSQDAAIFSAAVADYRPSFNSDRKIKKTTDSLTLELVRNPDILGSARPQFKYDGILVGFAAETENLEKNARAKLRQKECDLVVANDISKKGIGFDSDHNEVLLVYPEHTRPIPIESKERLAHIILQAVDDLSAEGS